MYNTVMKLLKKALPALAAICVLACATGCNTEKNYTFYTNMHGGYEIKDKSFNAGELIPGFTPYERGGEAPDGTGYTPKGITFYKMHTDATVVVFDDFTAEGAVNKYNEFTSAVNATLDDVDKSLSTSVANSDISKFNSAEAGAKVQISKIAYEVLSEAKRIYDKTEGYYNPALYYNVLAYGFGDNHRILKTKEELPKDEVITKYNELAAHFNEVELIQEGETHYAVKPEYTVEVEGETLTLHVDLGGIAKGYAVDKVEALFNEYGYAYGNFSYGASSMLIKRHVDGSYNIGLSSPRSPSKQPYLQIPVINEKISTSGDSEQYYTIDGTRYCHIIDAMTGKPVQTGIMSATVIGGGAAEDDALTTAIMAMGKEKAIKFIEEKLNDRKVIFTCE